MQLLTNTNTLGRAPLLRSNGTLDFNLLARIATDGVWSVGHSNTTPALTASELVQVHQRLGPGHVVAEDGCFTVTNYVQVRKLCGRVDDYLSYMEPEWAEKYGITTETSTTLSSQRVNWVLQELRRHEITNVQHLTVLTRSYEHAYWRPNVDARLEDERVSGICIEMNPDGNAFDNWFLGELVRKTLDRNKRCYLLLPPQLNDPTFDYVPKLRSLVDAVRRTGRLSDHRLFIVPSVYGSASTMWFGNSNSMESAIAFLKQQPEWNAEWSLKKVEASSELSGWPRKHLIDGFATTPWSSKVCDRQDERVEVIFGWDGPRHVNYIRFRPRWDTDRVSCFPQDFDLYYSDGASWQLIRDVRNCPSPKSPEWVTIPFGKTVSTHEIHIASKKLRPDRFGGYYFQLAEVAAGFANPVPA